MTVSVTKKALNVREKLAELDKPTGIAGEAMLRAETPQEQFNLIGAGRRNMIINGGQQISQRGDYTSATSTGSVYRLDRWRVDCNLSSYTIQQTSVDVPDMPVKGYAQKVAAVASSVSAYMGARQKIEFPELYAGRTFTYSAYIRSNNPNARLTCYMNSSPAQVVYSDSHSGNGQWERLSVTFTVNSGLTAWFCDVFLANEGIGGVLINSGDYIEFTGVQLELGKVATPFEHRSYGEELALCQRYFQVNGGIDEKNEGVGAAYSTAALRGQRQTFPVTMRATPSVTISNGEYYNGVWVTDATVISSDISPDGFCTNYSKTSAFVTRGSYPIQYGYSADAEI